MNQPATPTPYISEAEAETRLRANRQDAEAMMAKADHRFLDKDYRAAASFYNAAIGLAQGGASLPQDEVKRAVNAAEWLNGQFGQIMLDSLDAAGLTEAERHPRFQKSLEVMLGLRQRDSVQERYPSIPQSYFYPDLPYVQFADTEELFWKEELEDRADIMLSEASELVGDADLFMPYVQQTSIRPQGDVHGMLDKSDWSTCFLFENGAPVEDRVANCPELYSAVVDNVPLCRITKRAPSIMLSLLRPGARIPPHTGMINCRYVCHLPLIVPENCGFRVGTETRVWEPGELMVFDDTVEHEAWNESAENRLLLIFDIWHPDLEEIEQQQIATLFSIVDQT